MTLSRAAQLPFQLDGDYYDDVDDFNQSPRRRLGWPAAVVYLPRGNRHFNSGRPSHNYLTTKRRAALFSFSLSH